MPDNLTPEEIRLRTSALTAARAVLGDDAEVADLIAVAAWIVEGADPWSSTDAVDSILLHHDAALLPEMSRARDGSIKPVDNVHLPEDDGDDYRPDHG